MDRINLCVDIGNTRTKAALYRESHLLEYTEDMDQATLQEWMAENPKVLVAKSGKNKEVEARLEPTHYLDYTHDLPIELDYNTPETLGADRLAAAVGAHVLGPEDNWLILSMGTCITLDWLEAGVFRGGMIAPGLAMRYRAMNEFTASLPLVCQNPEARFPGKSTEECMQVGGNAAVVNEISGFVKAVQHKHPKVKLVQHGGSRINFGNALKIEIFARPKLVLEGLLYLLLQHDEKN